MTSKKSNQRPSFGIMTPPQQVGYGELLSLWQDADAVEEIEHAWLFDHLMPIGGDPNGPTFEGWTMLAALAAHTRRLRIGILVTSNRFRPPAMLAKIAATLDVVSAGRLDFGIGAGSRPFPPAAHREYAAHGLAFHDTAHAVASLDEACTLIRRLWTEPEPFDFHGDIHQVSGAFCNPKPLQHPTPPIVIGGRSTPTLRVVARHADIWNMPGGDPTAAAERSRFLDRCCAEIGRDPSTILRSTTVAVDYADLRGTLTAIHVALDLGFSHIVLILPAPYPTGVVQAIADLIRN